MKEDHNTHHPPAGPAPVVQLTPRIQTMSSSKAPASTSLSASKLLSTSKVGIQAAEQSKSQQHGTSAFSLYNPPRNISKQNITIEAMSTANISGKVQASPTLLPTTRTDHSASAYGRLDSTLPVLMTAEARSTSTTFASTVTADDDYTFSTISHQSTADRDTAKAAGADTKRPFYIPGDGLSVASLSSSVNRRQHEASTRRTTRTTRTTRQGARKQRKQQQPAFERRGSISSKSLSSQRSSSGSSEGEEDEDDKRYRNYKKQIMDRNISAGDEFRAFLQHDRMTQSQKNLELAAAGGGGGDRRHHRHRKAVSKKKMKQQQRGNKKPTIKKQHSTRPDHKNRGSTKRGPQQQETYAMIATAAVTATIPTLTPSSVSEESNRSFRIQLSQDKDSVARTRTAIDTTNRNYPSTLASDLKQDRQLQTQQSRRTSGDTEGYGAKMKDSRSGSNKEERSKRKKSTSRSDHRKNRGSIRRPPPIAMDGGEEDSSTRPRSNVNEKGEASNPSRANKVKRKSRSHQPRSASSDDALHSFFEWTHSPQTPSGESATTGTFHCTPNSRGRVSRRRLVRRANSTPEIHQFHLTPEWPARKRNGRLHSMFYDLSLRRNSSSAGAASSPGLPTVSARQMLNIMEPCSRREIMMAQGLDLEPPLCRDDSVLDYGGILDDISWSTLGSIHTKGSSSLSMPAGYQSS